MTKREWRLDNLFAGEAEGCASEMDSLETITPESVLDYAGKNPSSELHKCFEWDDTVAAGKYRMLQARKIIRSIVIISDTPDAPPVREFSITSTQNTYAPTRVIFRDPDEYEALLARALAELKAFQRKYSTLSELEAVFAAIDEL